MNCAYHPNNNAGSRCNSCSRFLCPACDHRIKGSTYCQDCIVAGIESLGRNGFGSHDYKLKSDGKLPLTAALFGLIPGLGAVFNGQNVKALVNFLIIIGLWTLADILGSPLETTFALASTTYYFYTIYDAYSSAQRRRMGEDLQAEDERLKTYLREHTNVWGGILIGTGVLALMEFLLPEQIYRFWPVLLIVAGFFLLRGYRRGRINEPVTLSYRVPPPSVIPAGYNRSTSDFANSESSYEKRI